MNEHDVTPDPPLTPEQAMQVSRLRQEDLWEIDRVLLAQSTTTWRKVARIVGMTIGELSARFPNIPDMYYAQRVRRLVAVGELESQGNLEYMRYSEVRLPARIAGERVGLRQCAPARMIPECCSRPFASGCHTRDHRSTFVACVRR